VANVIGKICAPTGNYIKDGEEKTSWSKCGVLLQTPNGYRIKMDVVPLGGDGWFSVFEDDDKQGQSQGSAKKSPSRASQEVDPDGDIPF
jgi:hypothetical protein